MTDRQSIAQSWLAAFQNRSIQMLEQLLEEDFSHTSPFGVIDGKQAYLDLVRANEEAFFANEIVVEDIIEGDDRSAIRYVVGEMDACDCIYAKDGKISKIFAYYHFGEKPSMGGIE